MALLALGQLADLVTTQAAMSRGAMEGNVVAAVIMSLGGLSLLWVVKGALVAAMALAIYMVRRYWDTARDRRAALAATVAWRGLQLCVLVLGVVAVHNVTVMTSMTQ